MSQLHRAVLGLRVNLEAAVRERDEARAECEQYKALAKEWETLRNKAYSAQRMAEEERDKARAECERLKLSLADSDAHETQLRELREAAAHRRVCRRHSRIADADQRTTAAASGEVRPCVKA